MPAMASIVGETVRQGGHHSAQKSTRTGAVAFSTSRSHVASMKMRVSSLAISEAMFQLLEKIQTRASPLRLRRLLNRLRRGGNAFRSRSRNEVGIQQFLEVRLTGCADLLLHHFAAFENQQHGDAANLVSHAGGSILVDVELSNLHSAGISVG